MMHDCEVWSMHAGYPYIIIYDDRMNVLTTCMLANGRGRRLTQTRPIFHAFRAGIIPFGILCDTRWITEGKLMRGSAHVNGTTP